MPDISLVPLPGSERSMLPGASVVGPVNPAEHIEVTVITRRGRLSGSAAKSSGSTTGAIRTTSDWSVTCCPHSGWK
jgi:hypothetical protein